MANLSANDLKQYIGRFGIVQAKTEGWSIRVRVEDARVAWGAVQLLVTPSDHECGGSAWVTVDRVQLQKGEAI